MPDFTKAKAEYIRGNVSYRELAEKYGVSLSTLMKYGAKEKWAELRKKTSVKTEEKIVETAAKQEAGRADMFNTIADKLLQRILSAVERGDIDTKRGYRDITGALKDLREIKGLKSEADMREQLARIRNLEKQASNEEDNDITVTVHINGDDNLCE